MEYCQKRIPLLNVASTCNDMTKEDWTFLQCLCVEESVITKYATILFQRVKPNF